MDNFYLRTKIIIKKAVNIFTENNISESSAGLCYYMIFSFFPFSMVVYATVSLVSIETSELENFFKTLIPEEISRLISGFFTHIDTQNGISFLIFGIFVTIYSLTRYVKALESKIRIIYKSKPQNTFKSWCLALITSQLLLIAFYVTVFVIIVGENLLEHISMYFILSKPLIRLYLILRFFVCAAVVFLALLFLYYIMPASKQKIKDILPGTTCVMVVWIAISYGFSYYMNNFSNYSVIYGTVGAFMILLLWLYFTNMILLAGAIINYNTHNKRALESTNIQYKYFEINKKER